jgi:hypothetical protein
MSHQLEITLRHGDAQHDLVIAAGDGDAAAEARERVNFIITVFAGTNEPKKRQHAKPPQMPKTSGLSQPGDKTTTGAK